VTDADRERIEHLSSKLDTGGLTTAQQFELAHLIRQFMEERDTNLAEIKRLLKLEKPSGWGYAH
jgi:hypothetical protein